MKKETSELTKQIVNNVLSQIDILQPTVVAIDGRDILVKSNLVLTMVDGKICSVLNEEASQNCYVLQMNNLNLIRKRKVNSLELGLSILHAWIKFFECILHISYRIDINLWRIQKKNKDMVDVTKKHTRSFSKRNGISS